MVWIVPALLWLALAPDRPRHGRAIAAVTAIVFWSAPIWWVPYKNTTDLHLSGLQLLAGNSFFLALVILLGGAAVLVLRGRSIQSRQTNDASGQTPRTAARGLGS
jgi:hypothetical protein